MIYRLHYCYYWQRWKPRWAQKALLRGITLLMTRPHYLRSFALLNSQTSLLADHPPPLKLWTACIFLVVLVYLKNANKIWIFAQAVYCDIFYKFMPWPAQKVPIRFVYSLFFRKREVCSESWHFQIGEMWLLYAVNRRSQPVKRCIWVRWGELADGPWRIQFR